MISAVIIEETVFVDIHMVLVSLPNINKYKYFNIPQEKDTRKKQEIGEFHI